MWEAYQGEIVMSEIITLNFPPDDDETMWTTVQVGVWLCFKCKCGYVNRFTPPIRYQYGAKFIKCCGCRVGKYIEF